MKYNEITLTIKEIDLSKLKQHGIVSVYIGMGLKVAIFKGKKGDNRGKYFVKLAAIEKIKKEDDTEDVEF